MCVYEYMDIFVSEYIYVYIYVYIYIYINKGRKFVTKSDDESVLSNNDMYKEIFGHSINNSTNVSMSNIERDYDIERYVYICVFFGFYREILGQFNAIYF
jgi:hypothetical protein